MKRRIAIWIVKQMRKEFDDRTILEIAKNSYHENMISWDDLLLICHEIEYEFYDWFAEKPDEEKRGECCVPNDIPERIDKYMNQYIEWISTPFFTEEIVAKSKCEAYLKCQKEWSNASFDGDDESYDKWSEKGHLLRDAFSREDWMELIGQSTGRAKYEYTRMMNAKFPQEAVQEHSKSAYERYLEYEKRIDALQDEGKWNEAEKLENEQLAIRNNEFTKEDWLCLIDDAKGSNRAVFEYTRMMKERFPDDNEQNKK